MNAERDNVWFENVDIFDDWGIAFGNKRFYVLFYDGFRGKTMPLNYAVPAHTSSGYKDLP